MPVNVAQLLTLPPDCITGTFLRRIKRFSVEFEFEGRLLIAHTNNTGSMLGLLRRGNCALFSRAANIKRRLPYTLERIRIGPQPNGVWVNVNTLLANRLFEAAFTKGLFEFCRGYECIRREKKYGQSRFDFWLTGRAVPDLWIECKSVTLVEDNIACFPDAPSLRARKHLLELMQAVRAGSRAAMFYLVQRQDCACFGPADFIDAEYAALFYDAIKAGVEIYAYKSLYLPHGYGLGERLPLARA